MAKKLTQSEMLTRYRKRVETSRKWREDEGYDKTWRRLVDLYALKHFEGFSPQDRIAVAISFSTINVIYPSISVNHPKTTLYARRPEDHDRAVISEAVLDWLWKTNEIGDEFRRAVKDFLIVGHGWVKTSYKFEEEEVPRSEDDINADFAKAASEADAYAAENPEMARGVRTDEEIMAAIPQSSMVTVEDRPTAERVSPHDVFVDPDATSMNDAKWIAQRMRRPLDEVRNDAKYDATNRRKVKADLESRFPQEQKSHIGRRKTTAEEDDQRVTVWEFYDLRAKTVAVFADQGEGFLVKPTKMPYQFGQPFYMIRNYDVPDQFYPLGDLEALEPLQHELNRTRSQLMEARQQFARKHLIRASAFGAEARAALESPDDCLVPVNETQGDTLQDLIVPIPVNQIPGELFSYGEMVQGDINTVSGLSDYQRGSTPEIRRTATEAAMIQDAVNARSADKLGIVEKAVAGIGKNLMNLARQFLTGEQVARIIGKEGLPIWVPFTQEDIDADCDFEVEGGSTMPKNEAWRQNQAMQLLQAVGPMIGQVIDPEAIAKYVLGAFGVKTPEKFIMAPPPPMPPGMEGLPPGMEGPPPGPEGPQPDMQGMPPPEGMPPPQPQLEGEPQLDPAVLAQLAGQVGLTLPPAL